MSFGSTKDMFEYFAGYGIKDPNDVVLLWDASNPRCSDSNNDFKSDDLNQNDLEQTTGGNKPVIEGTMPSKYATFDGNDFLYLKKIDDETGMTLLPDTPLYNLTDSGGASKFPAGTAYEATGTASYRGIWKDNNGDIIAWGYIGEQDAALTENNNYTSDFSSDVDGWSASNGAVAGNIDGIGGQDDNLRMTLNTSNSAHYVSKTSQLTVNKCYRIRVDYYIPSGQSNVDGVGLSDGSDFIGSVGNTTDSWTTLDFYHVATGTSLTVFAYDGASYIFADAGGDDVFYIRNVRVDEVTQMGTDAAHIYKEVSLSTRGWTGTGAGDPNDPSTLEIYKVLGDDNLTTDFSLVLVIKPDDGQPAAAEVLTSQYEFGGGNYVQWYIALLTSGNLYWYSSDDGGAGNHWEQSEDPVFTNGAQSESAMLGFTKSSTTVKLFKNGAEIDSNTGADGIPTTLFDSPYPLTVGARYTNKSAATYFNGQAGLCIIFDASLTPDQILDVYNCIRSRFDI